MLFYTINQVHPRKRADFTAMEVAENLQIFAYIHRHLVAGTLTATVDVKLKMYKFDEIKMLNFV